MLKSFFCAILIILVLIGIAAILYYISLRILSYKASKDYIVLIPATKDKTNIASQMYGVKMQLNLIGESYRTKVIVLDYGMQEETRRLCNALCRESNGIYVCKPEELNDILLSFGLQK